MATSTALLVAHSSCTTEHTRDRPIRHSGCIRDLANRDPPIHFNLRGKRLATLMRAAVTALKEHRRRVDVEPIETEPESSSIGLGNANLRRRCH